MEEIPLPPGIRRWLERQGLSVSEPPAAYYNPDGTPRKIAKNNDD